MDIMNLENGTANGRCRCQGHLPSSQDSPRFFVGWYLCFLPRINDHEQSFGRVRMPNSELRTKHSCRDLYTSLMTASKAASKPVHPFRGDLVPLRHTPSSLYASLLAVSRKTTRRTGCLMARIVMVGQRASASGHAIHIHPVRAFFQMSGYFPGELSDVFT